MADAYTGACFCGAVEIEGIRPLSKWATAIANPVGPIRVHR